MTDKPIPIDLVPFADLLDGSREFLRAWAKPEGAATYFVNPRALGADPALFGVALVDAARHAAVSWSRAVGISEEQAIARIWEGLEAERAAPVDNDLPPPVAVARKDD